MRRVVSSKVSPLRGLPVDGCHRETESLPYYYPASRPASAVVDFPFFGQNCSVVVGHRPLGLVNCDDHCIDVLLKGRFRLVQAQVNWLAVHSVCSKLVFGDREMLLETRD